MATKKSKKQIAKLYEKKCYFCGTEDYNILDAHRIIPGCEGGTYNWLNMLVICSNCHRKVHAGKIKVFRKYLSTSGRWILHYIDEQGVEQWK
jgi:predicted restriction endonuclease